MNEAVELLTAIWGELRAMRTRSTGSGPNPRAIEIKGRGHGQSALLNPQDPTNGFGAQYEGSSGGTIYSVEFGLVFPSGTPLEAFSSTVTPTNAEATIRFKVKGNIAQRRVSIRNGTTISGVAEAIDVTVRDVTSLVYFPSPMPVLSPYNVSIIMTPGTRPVHATPPLLHHWPSVTAIPPAAPKPVRIGIPYDAGVASYRFQWWGPTGSIAPSVEQTANGIPLALMNAADTTPPYVPIVPGADFLEIRTQDPTHTIAFSLDWGIDG